MEWVRRLMAIPKAQRDGAIEGFMVATQGLHRLQ